MRLTKYYIESFSLAGLFLCFSGFAHSVLAQPCQRVDKAALTDDWDPLSIAGQYRVQWVSTAEKTPYTAKLRLFLWKTSMRDSSTNEHKTPPAGDTVVHPLYGILVPDSGNFTKHRIDRLRASVDPIYPPVLLMTRSNPRSTRRSNEWTVLLLETVSNRRDNMLALDGGGTGMWIKDSDSNGFRGIFDRWGIIQSDKGYYCAYRVRR